MDELGWECFPLPYSKALSGFWGLGSADFGIVVSDSSILIE